MFVLEFTDWLAIAAFALSLITLAINLTLTWLRWPRIAVEAMEIRGGPDGETLVLRVINNGSEAFTIRSIGWRTDESHG